MRTKEEILRALSILRKAYSNSPDTETPDGAIVMKMHMELLEWVLGFETSFNTLVPDIKEGELK